MRIPNGIVPFKRAYTRPLSRTPRLNMLACSSISPVLTTLPDARVGRWIRHWCSPTAWMDGYSRGVRIHRIELRSNAPILALPLNLLALKCLRTDPSHMCPGPDPCTTQMYISVFISPQQLGCALELDPHSCVRLCSVRTRPQSLPSSLASPRSTYLIIGLSSADHPT